MTDNWYWAEGPERRGPVDVDELTRLVGAGQVAPETPVWCPGFSEWQPAAHQPWFAPSRAMTPPPLVAAGAAPQSLGMHQPVLGSDAGATDASASLPCPACRSVVAAEAVRCPNCHVGFLGGFGPSWRAIWPRARFVVLGVAVVLAALSLGEGVGVALAGFPVTLAMGAAITAGYAKVVADRSTTLGESVRVGGRWQESGGGRSGFLFFWSD